MTKDEKGWCDCWKILTGQDFNKGEQKMIGYYTYIFKCNDCLHFNTEHCPFNTTKESVANPECFRYTVTTISGTGTNTEISTQGTYTTTNKTE